MSLGWAVTLNGVTLSGGDLEGLGCLTSAPDGLGKPDLRTEDVTYPQRDGVRHFSDWYEPRILTLDNVTICPDGCDKCPSALEKSRAILHAWSRQCDDVELVLHTDCDPGPVEDVLLRQNLHTNPFALQAGPSPWSASGTPHGVSEVEYDSYRGLEAQLTASGSVLVMNTTPSDASVKMRGIDDTRLLDISLQVRRSAPGDVALTVVFFDNAGGVTGAMNTPTVSVPSGVVTPVTGSVLPPTGSTQAVLAVQFAAPGGAGDTVWVGAVLVNQSGATGEAFNGETPNTEDLRYNWIGDPFLSGSQEWDTSSQPDRSVVGPFGIIGRPRVANITPVPGRSKCRTGVFRFDAVDHRMYILDGSGEPGSGTQTVTVLPTTSQLARCYPRCYPMCYDTSTGSEAGPVTAYVAGTECAYPVICFHGRLTSPTLENTTTGDTIGYDGNIGAGAEPVCIDTSTGSATQGEAGRDHLISGNPEMILQPGDNILRLVSQSAADDGHVTVEWRGSVISA